MVNKKLIEKIDELVGSGVRNVLEMKRALNIYVKMELFDDQSVPPLSSRRFFPENRDIYNHMYKSRMKSIFSKIDQENLYEKMKEWKMQTPDDNFYFREYGEKCNERLFFNENAERILTGRCLKYLLSYFLLQINFHQLFFTLKCKLIMNKLLKWPSYPLATIIFSFILIRLFDVYQICFN